VQIVEVEDQTKGPTARTELSDLNRLAVIEELEIIGGKTGCGSSLLVRCPHIDSDDPILEEISEKALSVR
jgi:hypothetical protein